MGRTKGKAPGAPTGSDQDFQREFLGYLSIECGLAENTVAAYRSDLERFRAFLARTGTRFHAKIGRDRIRAFLDDCRRRGDSPVTIRRRASTLRTFFRFLVMEGRAGEDPTTDLLLPKTWKRLPDTLSPRELGSLVEHAGAGTQFPLRDRAIVEVLYSCGLRVTELCDLTLAALHVAEGFLRCRGKRGKERLVPIGGVARHALRSYLEKERPPLALRGGGPEHVFLSLRGRRLGRETIGRLLEVATQRSGIKKRVTPHTLRHSFATHLLAGGAGLREVQELLGHADIRTTEIYTHVEHSRLKGAHRKYHPRA